MKIKCCKACNFGGHKCQDAFVARLYDDGCKGLFVVCDEMDWLHMGAEVGKTVVDVFVLLISNMVTSIILGANQRILKKVKSLRKL